tara:strand:- start:736 stop:1452 length:717 start_codon:yes stop_codon:yes gene_type:complete
MIDLDNYKVQIFADGASLDGIKRAKQNPLIKGFTTNPTLMRASGITDYKKFALEALEIIDGSSISFEVFSDDLDEMYSQAKKISSWGSNISVKIPITNTKGQSTTSLVKSLNEEKIVCNVTAMFTLKQVEDIYSVINSDTEVILSIFAGRIADTGLDPLPIMKEAVNYVSSNKNIKILWASPREALNIVQANEVGCSIITVTEDLLKKTSNFNKNLDKFSIETVAMFYKDAQKSGFNI